MVKAHKLHVLYSVCYLFMKFENKIYVLKSRYLDFKTAHSARKKYGLKLEVVLKWRDIYIENIRVVSLMAMQSHNGETY